MGRHNIKNTLAAIAVSAEIGIPFTEINRALQTFQGVKRRQEVLAEVSGVTVIDDFAHHPTAVSETLAAIRGRFPRANLWAIFEPRSNTTRRNIFQKEFILSFDPADEIILAAPYQPEKIPEDQRLNPERLIEDLQTRGKKARYLPSVDQIVEVIGRETSSGDILCLMSNGGFGGVYDKVIRRLQ
jgi:UDP-N-acetylmuramate: L-alanyl-gamma-D-glutamyl-meso-diaminopimelate ligase